MTEGNDADAMDKEGTEDEGRNWHRVTENHIRKLNSIRSSAAQRWKKVVLVGRNAFLQYLPICESSFFAVIHLSCPAAPSCKSIPPSSNQPNPTRSPFAGFLPFSHDVFSKSGRLCFENGFP